jgi:hypothetical protein
MFVLYKKVLLEKRSNDDQCCVWEEIKPCPCYVKETET